MLGSVPALAQALSKRGAFGGVKGEFCPIHLYTAIPRYGNGTDL